MQAPITISQRPAAATGQQPSAQPAARSSQPSAAASPTVATSAAPAQAALFARYFVEMRHHLRLSPEEVAGWLNTTPDTIMALEQGATHRLPMWPETVRIVTAYAGALNVDGTALLRLIAAELETVVLGQARTQPAASEPPSRPATPAEPQLRGQPQLPAIAGRDEDHGEDEDEDHADPRRRWYARPKLLLSVALVGLAVAGIATTPLLGALARRLPVPAANFVRGAAGGVSGLFAAKREGLTWIEVADPRSRRGDKLPVHRR